VPVQGLKASLNTHESYKLRPMEKCRRELARLLAKCINFIMALRHLIMDCQLGGFSTPTTECG